MERDLDFSLHSLRRLSFSSRALHLLKMLVAPIWRLTLGERGVEVEKAVPRLPGQFGGQMGWLG